MSTTVIATALVIGIVFIVIIMAISQARHKAKQARLERIQLLSTQNKQIKNSLNNLPANFLSKGIREFLQQTLIANYKQILKLEPDNPDFVKADLADTIKARQDAKQRKDVSGAVLNDIFQVNAARSTLKSIYDLVKTSFENKRINTATAEKLLNEVEEKMLTTAIDFYSARGEKAMAENKFKEGMSSWSKVVDMLSSNKKKASYAQEIIDAQGHIKQIQKKWREYNTEVNEKNAELANNMEDFLTKQEDWKKRQDYD
jgi:hypothetical protein